MVYTLEALGTLLKIDTLDEILEERLILFCFEEVKKFEAKFSRFDKTSLLSQINKHGYGEIDDEFLSLIQLSKHIYEKSHEYFDITIASTLENRGYGIQKEVGNENTSFKDVIIEGNTLRLVNGAWIDLGGVGKGYIIDVLFAHLDKVLGQFIINFGGDIRVKGRHKIGLEDPFVEGKLIGEIWVENASLCASSGQKRKVGNEHHLINPKTKHSQNETLAVFTLHRLASFADTYATALFVAPLSESLEILESVDGLEGLIITKKGEIYQSQGFQCELY